MKIICTKCKNEMADSDKFCPTCGFSKEEILGINTEVTNFEPMIEVYRESSLVGWVNDYIVFVDGKELGRLGNGDKKRFKLEQGLHEIQIKQNWSWFYSPKESFLLKDFSKFTCKPRFGIFSPFRLNFYSLFKSKKFILLTQA